MMKKYVVIGLLISLLLVSGEPAAAQGIFGSGPSADTPTGVSTDACRQSIVLALAREQRRFRAVIYGFPKPEFVPAGTVRFSAGGQAWIKVKANEWKSAAPGFESTNWSDSDMNQQGEFYAEWSEGRIGFFQTRRLLTSEIVPYIAVSALAFQCRADTVCARTEASFEFDQPAGQPVTVQMPGCIEFDLQSLPSCHYAALDGNQSAITNTMSFCQETVDDLLNREAQIVTMATEYDAAYRSLLQFSGNFDLFIDEFRWPLTFTLRQAAGLIGQLNRIPCFLSSCDDVPNLERP